MPVFQIKDMNSELFKLATNRIAVTILQVIW